MKKEISFDERRNIQLDMLKEIDTFCRKNNIKYSIAYGTLLGAVRHKGFIPWDDDVDIMMPLPDMLRFKQQFKSKTLKFCDVDTEPHYSYSFPRITHTGTFSKAGLSFMTYGICIDVYTFVSIPDNKSEQDLFFSEAEVLSKKRLSFLRWDSRFRHFLPIKVLPGSDNVVRRFRDFLLNTFEYGSFGTYFVISGPLAIKDKMIYDVDLFEKLIEVEFEGSKFLSVAQYDLFLKKRYGDYMQLPPEDQRHPYHGGHYYWK